MPYLDADLITARLPAGLPCPARVEVYAETASTNDVAWRLGQGGVAEGAVVFAESQTKGRGTRGRAWQSPVGKGLWLSILLRPDFPLERWTRLTPAVAVAVARTVESVTGLEAQLKWANDVYLQGRKVCGILTEASVSGPQRFLVLGIGLNVLQEAADFPPELEGIANSLKLATSRDFIREEVAATLLGEVFQAYAACATDTGFQYLLRDYRARNYLQSREVRVEDGQSVHEGVVTGIGEEGQLLLDGDREVRAGTVMVK
jgi:BirA family biotin operon repressor/biotin-[acetyl-CoA-carboxylase] ligase